MTDGGSSDRPQNPDNAKPLIVGIGASAGGIRALQTLLGALPEQPGAAFVIVVHLDPQSQSQLASILATRTKMPVVQVGTNERLQENHVYVISPGRRLHLANHEVSAAAFDEPHGHRLPIDLFFRSLAEYGDGFAVILTGAGSDGAVGAKQVKEAGGIVLVQDPTEAEYPSMPRSVIATGVADVVLPVRELAARLAELLRSRSSRPTADEHAFDDDLLRRVLAHLRVRTGHDFSKYKRSTVMRRIARRMQVTRAAELKDYYELLRDNPAEAESLLGDLLISVTTFFRDKEVFEELRTHVVPLLFAAENAGETIRAWVPGCATGEEAYSIAMLLLEEASRHETRPPIQVFGSDIDARGLAKARDGRYPAAIEADVDEERLRRFFLREGDHYRVKQELRDSVLFANHNVLKDPPFLRINLVSCRNLLIYLDREVQESLCSTFHYALKPGGFLLVGSSETADNPPGLFRCIDRAFRLYQSTAQPMDKPRLLPRLLSGTSGIREQELPVGRPVTPATALSEAIMHRRSLENIAPPSILVDATHRAVHFSGGAGRFIQPSGGPLSGDVVDLVRPELRFELRSALHRAFEQRLSSLSLPMLVRFNGSPHRVLIHVKPASEDDQSEPRNAIVMFIEGEAVDKAALASGQQPATDETVRRLTQELELAQGRLRTVRDESEATNEELRAANEELQSINEEYRSTSEELETSKEELQSINEELQMVNTELKHKLEAISRTHSDLQNLMAATDFAILFLDSGLRIKRFTERVKDLFSITPSDEGRPITDFAHQLEYDELIKDARAVLSDLAPIRREIRSRSARWYELRMRPYRTVDDKIDGVVISFVDVTERREVEQALLNSDRRLQQLKRLFDLARSPVMVWDLERGILEWNRGCEERYGYSREEALGKQEDQLLRTTVPGSSVDELKARLQQEGRWIGTLRHWTKTGKVLTVEASLQLEALDGRHLVLESIGDILDG